jgi:hypothetical protein
MVTYGTHEYVGGVDGSEGLYSRIYLSPLILWREGVSSVQDSVSINSETFQQCPLQGRGVGGGIMWKYSSSAPHSPPPLPSFSHFPNFPRQNKILAYLALSTFHNSNSGGNPNSSKLVGRVECPVNPPSSSAL